MNTRHCGQWDNGLWETASFPAASHHKPGVLQVPENYSLSGPELGIIQLLHSEKASAEAILPSTVEERQSLSGVFIIKYALCTCISVWFGAQESSMEHSDSENEIDKNATVAPILNYTL